MEAAFAATFCNYEKQWKEGIRAWDKLLKKSLNQTAIRKLFIVGGSDAHGDFNFGILVNPLSGNLMTDNAFGKVRTLVYCEEFTEEKLAESLKNGQCVVTDGPVVKFKITGSENDRKKSGGLGETISITKPKLKFEIEWKSTKEFGPVKEIKLFKKRKSKLVGIKRHKPKDGFSDLITLEWEQKQKIAYYRVEAWSEKGSEKFYCFTNPIWVVRKS